MNVSRFQGLEVLKIKAKRIDSDQASLKFKLIKVNGESTSDWQIVHRTEKLVQAVTIIPAKAAYAAWSSEQVFLSLSLTTDTSLSLTINRDLMKDEDKIFATHNNSLKNTFCKLHSFILSFHLFTFCL